MKHSSGGGEDKIKARHEKGLMTLRTEIAGVIMLSPIMDPKVSRMLGLCWLTVIEHAMRNSVVTGVQRSAIRIIEGFIRNGCADQIYGFLKHPVSRRPSIEGLRREAAGWETWRRSALRTLGSEDGPQRGAREIPFRQTPLQLAQPWQDPLPHEALAAARLLRLSGGG